MFLIVVHAVLYLKILILPFFTWEENKGVSLNLYRTSCVEFNSIRCVHRVYNFTVGLTRFSVDFHKEISVLLDEQTNV